MFRRLFPVLLLVLGSLTACTSSPDTSGPMPDARMLADASAATLDGLHSVRFKMSVSGTIPSLDVREVDGQASRDGGPHGVAAGTADVQESADRFDADYVLSGDTLYLTDARGVRHERPVPVPFTPAVLLDPQRGLKRLLTGASELRTEVKETLDDAPTYRLTGKLPAPVISAVVPGIQNDVGVKFWVSQGDPPNLMRVWLQVPPVVPAEGAVMVELSLSEPNVPVTVAPPAG